MLIKRYPAPIPPKRTCVYKIVKVVKHKAQAWHINIKLSKYQEAVTDKQMQKETI